MKWKKKKFWTSMNISYSNEDKAYIIKLDDRPYFTRNGEILKITSSKLVKKVKGEWEKITGTFSSSKLPLTNILEQLQSIDKKLSKIHLTETLEYANTDLICYRVETPVELRKLQEKQWDPILNIYYEKYGIGLVKTYGLRHVLQDQGSMLKFSKILKDYNPQKRFIVCKITHLLGSALLSVLIEKRIISKNNAWNLSRIEEDWQQKMWGIDDQSVLAEKNKKRDFNLYITCLQGID